MKTITKIDNAGRLVIPKALRRRFGFDAGRRVRLIPNAEGVTIVPEVGRRRFIKRGPLLTIATGAKAERKPASENIDADMGVFDVAALRDESLDGKIK